MSLIAFPSDGLSMRDLKLVIDEGLRHGCTVESLALDDGTVAAVLVSRKVGWHVTRARWHVTRVQGRYTVHSVFGVLMADGIVLSEVLKLAFRPAMRAS